MSWLPDVTAWVGAWSSYYGDHAALSTSITYLHLAGLVVGGGAAVTTDRQILRAWREGGERRTATLLDVATVHAFVIGGLVVIVASGALMMLADFDTFRASRIFWLKMGAVGLLLANGGVLNRAESLARRTDGARGWPILAAASTVSLTLWLITLFLGTYLKTAA